MRTSVYKNDAGRDAVANWCRYAIDHWRTPHETRILRTRLGITSVLVAGGGREAPLVVLPGTNFSAAALLPFADVLARRRHAQVLLVDVPGQPGLSDEHRGADPAEYGAWLDEVLFQLDPSPRPIVLGHSLGAAIALQADPENPRLGPLVLVAPAGFVGARLSIPLLKTTVPWLVKPNHDTAHSLAELMTSPANEVHPMTTDWLRVVGRHCRATKAPAPTPGPELARWRDHAVHFVLGADDPFFPPGKVLAAARAAGVPTTYVTTIADAGHLLPQERPDTIVDVLRAIDERRTSGH